MARAVARPPMPPPTIAIFMGSSSRSEARSCAIFVAGVMSGLLSHRFTLNAKAELIDPASYASGQLMGDLVGRDVVLQAVGVAQKALQHAGLPPSPLSHTAVSRFAHAG